MTDFWLWWSAELAGLVPAWMKQPGSVTSGKVTIEFRDNVIYMLKQVKGQADSSIEFSSNDESTLVQNSLYEHGDTVTLLLSKGSYLQKRISLPQAAIENLRGVLEFEMDRHTPFKSSQVYFDFHIATRNTDNQQLVIELIAAPRTTIDKFLDTLSRYDIPVNKIEIDETKDLSNINLLERNPGSRSKFNFRNRLTNFHIAVGIATFLILTATIATPLLQKRATLLHLQPLLEDLGGRATSIQSSRVELEKLVADHNFLVEKKLRKPPTLAVLEELARLLPDETWLHRVVIAGNEVEVVGETDSSATVIRLVEGSDLFVNTNFQSPLIKGKSGKERFHLSTEFGQDVDTNSGVALK